MLLRFASWRRNGRRALGRKGEDTRPTELTRGARQSCRGSLSHGLGGSLSFFNCWEAEGRWLAAVKRVIIALISKLCADAEAKLRPSIGFLSYIYTVWMSVREQDLRQWSFAFHGSTHEGVASMAFRTAAKIKMLAHWRERVLSPSWIAVLCSERIENRTAGERGMATGRPSHSHVRGLHTLGGGAHTSNRL